MTVTIVTEQEPDLLREATEWFARLDSPDFSEADSQRLNAWRQRSPAHEQSFQQVLAMWQAPEFAAALTSAAEHGQAALARPRHRKRRWNSAMAVAAMVLLATVWFFGPGVLHSLRADVSTATGEMRTVRLPDDSSIVLNTNTALSSQMTGATRRIRLWKGEALFQVQADPARPFVVEYDRHEVRVLGTEFVVRERPSGIQVTVIHGSVEVWGGDTDQSVHLADGQQVAVGPEGYSAVRAVNVAEATAWTKRRLVVADRPLPEVLEEIQRYHPGYVVTWNPAIRSVRVTGMYDLSNTSETLTVLAKTLPIHMDRLTDRLIIVR